jgi:hypothetical protein
MLGKRLNILFQKEVQPSIALFVIQ